MSVIVVLSILFGVMPGPELGIHVFGLVETWMAGS
jgi:hypothetical protein